MAKKGSTTTTTTPQTLTNPDDLIDVKTLKYFEQKTSEKFTPATVAEVRAALSELT